MSMFFRVVAVVIFIALTSALAQQPSGPLDNAAIVKMVQGKVPDDLILQTINQAQEVRFSLLPADLISLKQWGVSDEVVRAMAARAAGRTSPTPPVAAPAAPSPPVAPQTPRPAPPVPTSPPTTTSGPAEEGPYISSGMNEVLLNGVVAIPHSDVSGTTANVRVGYGRYLTDWFAIGPVVAADFYGSQVHDITVAGVAQFVPRISDRFYLVAGVGAGVNNVKVFESDTDLAVTAYFGPRVFLVRHLALDVQYALLYRRFEGLGFKDSSESRLGVGFAVVF